MPAVMKTAVVGAVAPSPRWIGCCDRSGGVLLMVRIVGESAALGPSQRVVTRLPAMESESNIAEEIDDLDLDVIEENADEETPSAVAEVDGPNVEGPSVDALEDRLRDLQGAMDKLQSGDLDAAEQAINTLEQQMETTRD